MEWSDEVIERLRAFWSEGHSTAEIGRRLGVSKNAVVGKAHRLGLTARPSPIRRGAVGEPPRRLSIKRAVGPTLPPLSELLPPPPPPLPMPPPVRVAVAAVAPAPVRIAPPPSLGQGAAHSVTPGLRPVTRSSGGGRVIPCCWPIGEPGTRSFRFCDAASAAGKPYCAEHAAQAYVKIRDRREDAA